MRIIITGATGMVGEGVMQAAILRNDVDQILLVSRKEYEISHPKVQQLIVKDFFKIDEVKDRLKDYDGCMFCLGVSSVGMSKEDYRKYTYDLTINFAKVLLDVSPQAVFCYVSGTSTSTAENSKMNWANVKGKTENDLMRMAFRGVYCFRPGAMLPFKDAKNIGKYKWFAWIVYLIKFFKPKSILTLKEVGEAMVNLAAKGNEKKVLEIADIRSASIS